MWLLFSGSFNKHLREVLGYDTSTAKDITAKAKVRYAKIISRLPEFEKEDRFKMNIVSCAMFSAFLMKMPRKPSVEKAADYYRESMMTGLMKLFCRMSGKNKFTDNDIESMEETATLKAADRNPYSWNMEFLPYEDGSKIVRCVEEVEKIWRESAGIKGTQLIFCDMGVPKGKATSVR